MPCTRHQESSANALVLAHEIGHELGADDVYVAKRIGTDQYIDVINVGFRYDHAPDDWSNGCINGGPGYYGRDMTCERIIERLLMNGEGAEGRDLTIGGVYGVRKDANGGYYKTTVPIGFF